MMGFASLLIVLGLYGHRTLLAGRRGRSARIGFWLTMIGLGVPAVVELAVRAAMPPLLMPLAATGLILLATAHRRNPFLPTTSRVVVRMPAAVPHSVDASAPARMLLVWLREPKA